MAGGFRCHLIIGILLLSCAGLLGQEKAPAHVTTTTPAHAAVTDDAIRLLELGQCYLGQNNPRYARKPAQLDMQTRNAAGEQARRTLKQVTALYPKFADGWLWLGIALTETLHYTDKCPEGTAEPTPDDVAEGLRAFRTAYEYNPSNIVYVTYFSEASMVYRKDFDGARKLWEQYFTLAKTDLQRVTALTQTGRACLNKAYYGKKDKTLSSQEVKQLFVTAENYVQQAAKLCPNATDVKSMQALLQQYRSMLYGK